MKFTMFELWSHMGLGARLITSVMLVMAAACLVVTCERLVALLQAKRQSREFARKLADLLHDGDLDRAANAPLPAAGGYLGRVLSGALRTYLSCPKYDEDLTFESVARVLERHAQREVHNMKRGVGVLATVASIAPFVGLLGTVLGIVDSFQMMAETGSGGLSTVSAGIAEALGTTALGLVVAIPALSVHNALQSFIDARAVDISEASNELLDLLARHLAKIRSQAVVANDVREPSLSFRPRPSVAPQR